MRKDKMIYVIPTCVVLALISLFGFAIWLHHREMQTIRRDAMTAIKPGVYLHEIPEFVRVRISEANQMTRDNVPQTCKHFAAAEILYTYSNWTVIAYISVEKTAQGVIIKEVCWERT